jgi:hypothetical protein
MVEPELRGAAVCRNLGFRQHESPLGSGLGLNKLFRDKFTEVLQCHLVVLKIIGNLRKSIPERKTFEFEMKQKRMCSVADVAFTGRVLAGSEGLPFVFNLAVFLFKGGGGKRDFRATSVEPFKPVNGFQNGFLSTKAEAEKATILEFQNELLVDLNETSLQVENSEFDWGKLRGHRVLLFSGKTNPDRAVARVFGFGW